jgi:putative heme iron utilization protein
VYNSRHIQRTAASHLRSSSSVHVSGSPLGSGVAGNISPPQMAHAAVAVTKPAKAKMEKDVRLAMVNHRDGTQGDIPRTAFYWIN